MKIAQALMRRADLKTRMQQVNARMVANATHQEDQKPAESASSLFVELLDVIKQYHNLVAAINTANANTTVEIKDVGQMTLNEALCGRASLKTRAVYINALVEATLRATQRHYDRDDIKTVSVLDIQKLRKEADVTNAQFRAFNEAIEARNWEVEI